MKRHRITSFYMETLFLIAVFIAVILVLTRVFGIGRSRSQEAKLLTNAVSLAQNAAEAVSGSSGLEDVAELLKQDSDGSVTVNEDRELIAWYDEDMNPDPEGKLKLVIGWEPQETASGTLVHCPVTVWQEDQPEQPVYTIQTAVFYRSAGTER